MLNSKVTLLGVYTYVAGRFCRTEVIAEIVPADGGFKFRLHFGGTVRQTRVSARNFFPQDDEKKMRNSELVEIRAAFERHIGATQLATLDVLLAQAQGFIKDPVGLARAVNRFVKFFPQSSRKNGPLQIEVLISREQRGQFNAFLNSLSATIRRAEKEQKAR